MKIGKIEKNVPIPEVHSKIKFPWSEMEVGDLIIVRTENGESIETLKQQVKGSTRYYGVRTGKKFKSLVNKEEKAVRIWRIS